MALDAIYLQAILEELRPKLLGLRVDKVQQPSRDQLILLLRGNRLLLNAGANAPRIQLTELVRENPAEPPMFCMLLRKHLVGGKVAGDHPAGAGTSGSAGAGYHRRIWTCRPPDAGAGGDGPAVQPDFVRRGGPHHRLPAPGRRRYVRAETGASGAILPDAFWNGPSSDH